MSAGVEVSQAAQAAKCRNLDNNFKFGDQSHRIGDPCHQNEHLTIFLSIQKQYLSIQRHLTIFSSIQKQKLDVLEMFSIFSIFSLLKCRKFYTKNGPWNSVDVYTHLWYLGLIKCRKFYPTRINFR